MLHHLLNLINADIILVKELSLFLDLASIRYRDLVMLEILGGLTHALDLPLLLLFLLELRL